MKEFNEDLLSELPLLLVSETSSLAPQGQANVMAATYVDDDRYPGSFFRIPGRPIPGKTTWSIN